MGGHQHLQNRRSPPFSLHGFDLLLVRGKCGLPRPTLLSPLLEGERGRLGDREDEEQCQATNPWQHPKFSHRIFSEVTCRENFILPRKGIALLGEINATWSYIKEEVGLTLYYPFIPPFRQGFPKIIR